MTQPDKSRNRPDESDVAVIRAARPAAWVAAIVLGLEALGVIGYGVLIILNLHNVSAGVGYAVAGMLIAWGIALGLVGRGIGLIRTWSRGPAVALQLFQLPLAWGFRGSIGWLAAALFVSAAVVLVCLFVPVSNAAFTRGRRLPGDRS